jgi:hypothetical protein
MRLGQDGQIRVAAGPRPTFLEFLGRMARTNAAGNLTPTEFAAVTPDVKPGPAALEFASRVACLSTIADAIRAKLNPNSVDISGVMGQVKSLLDESITGVTITAEGPPPLDLSKIDFELLAKRYKMSKHKNTEYRPRNAEGSNPRAA